MALGARKVLGAFEKQCPDQVSNLHVNKNGNYSKARHKSGHS